MLDGTTLLSSANSLSGGSNPFNGGPLALNVGHSLVFNITNNSPETTGSIDGIGFSVSAVPLPAGLPLALSAFGIMAVIRIAGRRSSATA